MPTSDEDDFKPAKRAAQTRRGLEGEENGKKDTSSGKGPRRARPVRENAPSDGSHQRTESSVHCEKHRFAAHTNCAPSAQKVASVKMSRAGQEECQSEGRFSGGDFQECSAKKLPAITTRYLQIGERSFVCKVVNSNSGVQRLLELSKSRPLLSWRLAFQRDDSDDDDEPADTTLCADSGRPATCDDSTDALSEDNGKCVLGMAVACSADACWFVTKAAFRTTSEFWDTVSKILNSGDSLKVDNLLSSAPSSEIHYLYSCV